MTRALPAAVFLAAAAALPAADDPAAIARRKAAHRPRMSFLDNGTIRLGVDLNLGGAITYLSASGRDDNVVNNWDWGRQVQMSHYGGPAPFRVRGKEPAKAWADFPWNPVQAGDHFGHPARVTESRNTGAELAVTCVPMQWSLPDVPCECTFSTRITLDGPTARVRCTVRNRRTDPARYPAFAQELPAVYVNGPYHRLVTYAGDRPFTGGTLTRVKRDAATAPPGFPWARFLATERWAAQVNDAGRGLGVYQPRCVEFLGGFAGRPGTGGTADFPTGYIAPTRPEVLDADIAYEYEYVLILGTLDEIRARANALHGDPRPPAYRFARDRQGWAAAGAADRGVPAGEWDVPVPKAGAQLVGPVDFWRAEAAPVLAVEAAFTAAGGDCHVYWATHADPRFAAGRRVSFPVVGDGGFRTYTVRLADAAGYAGGVVRLRLDPPAGAADDRVRVRSVTLGPVAGKR